MNLRVVVIIVVMTGVNQVMVKKMNICPHAAAIFNIHKCCINDRYGRIMVWYSSVMFWMWKIGTESFVNGVVLVAVYNQVNCPVA